jgi:hypothetical protein
MMAARAQLSSSGCRACRSVALELFTQTFIPRTTRFLPRTQALPSPAKAHSTFRPTLTRRSDAPSPSIRERIAREETEDDLQAQQDGSEVTSNLEKPWYLDVETPRHPTAIFEPPRLPDVPDDAPKLVSPLVEFTSTELGLDDLNLMDLREIHPPPALGPQLMMLFGTARSERHLHVSADRLVRWLRGRGVSTNADGLLGRNELKIKLRRRARKAKMLGTSGGGMRHDEDDGIRTGWVCVNLGTTGWSDVEAEVLGEDGQVLGFGVPQTGTTLVVQIMTEAKRKELDLETLWSRTLERCLRAKATIDAANSEIESEVDRIVPDAITSLGSGSPPSMASRRLFSTMAPCRSTVSTTLTDSLEAQHSSTLVSTLQSSSLESLEFGNTGGMQPVDRLYKLRLDFDRLSPEGAIQALTPSNPPSKFLKHFSVQIAALTPAESWSARTWLQVNGQLLGHPQYGLVKLVRLVDEMELDGISVQQDDFQLLLRGIIGAPYPDMSFLQARCKLALRVFDVMSLRGMSVLTPTSVVTLITALIQSGAQGKNTRDLQARLELLLAEADLPYMGEESLKQLLVTYALQGNWERLWDTWRIPPKYEAGRSRELYSFLLGLVAQTNHQMNCIEALRWVVPEMLHEIPPITPNAQLIDSLRTVARIADPGAAAGAARVIELSKVFGQPATGKQFAEAKRLMFNEFVRLFVFLKRYENPGSFKNAQPWTGKEMSDEANPYHTYNK